MPNTKYSFMRCRILDRCFRSPKLYQVQDLMDACEKELNMGISRRTIYNDIDFMKSNDGWNAPIDTTKDGNRRYYHYTDPDFSIEKMPITEAQLKQIQAAIDMLNSFEGLDQFEGLQDSFSKFGLVALKTEAKPCFCFDHNEFLEGLKFLTPLFNAIQYETVLKIRYKPFENDVLNLVFHPQFLKQYNNRWYILGMEQKNMDQIWNLALDRIQQIKTTKLPYVKAETDWTTFFEDIIGVTNEVNIPVEKVHFQVHGNTSHYIKTKPLHGSQKAHWIDPNTLDVTIEVKINTELKNLLLSYAPSITILSPQSLVEEHKASLRKALEQY